MTLVFAHGFKFRKNSLDEERQLILGRIILHYGLEAEVRKWPHPFFRRGDAACTGHSRIETGTPPTST